MKSKLLPGTHHKLTRGRIMQSKILSNQVCVGLFKATCRGAFTKRDSVKSGFKNNHMWSVIVSARYAPFVVRSRV